MKEDAVDPYSDGVDAGMLTGRYTGRKDTPSCPFPEDTEESRKWWDGFGDGLEDFIAYQRSA